MFITQLSKISQTKDLSAIYYTVKPKNRAAFFRLPGYLYNGCHRLKAPYDSVRIYFTLTLQEAMQLLPSVLIALIVQVPRPFAVILPLESTVATFVSDEVHFSFLVLAVSGRTVAFSV